MTSNIRSKRRLRRLLISFILLVLTAAIATIALSNPPAWFVAFLGAAAVGLGVMISRHARRTIYRCTSCSHTFKISAWNDFVSPHVPERKLLICPSCGLTDWQPTIGSMIKTRQHEDQLV